MSHPTRQALIEAGFALASTESLNHITVDAIVKQAGVAKGTFYVHFADRAAFLLALHVHFHGLCCKNAGDLVSSASMRGRKRSSMYGEAEFV